MTEPAVIDGTAVEEPEGDAVQAPLEPVDASHSTELAVRQRRHEVVRPLDAGQLVDSFRAYQDLLPRLLTDTDYQDAGRGKKFVKKSGWRKIATAFDLDVIEVASSVDRDDKGMPVRASATWRAIAPSGRIMDGDGYCALEEERFSGPRGNRSKLEHDLRSTAATRAKNRAIADLVGMGAVSAEEADGSGHEPEWWTVEATSERKRDLLERLTTILYGNRDAAVALLQSVKGRIGVTPELLPAFVGGLLTAIQRLEQDMPTAQPDT